MPLLEGCNGTPVASPFSPSEPQADHVTFKVFLTRLIIIYVSKMKLMIATIHASILHSVHCVNHFVRVHIHHFYISKTNDFFANHVGQEIFHNCASELVLFALS